MKVLITGVAGFIGFHVAKASLERGDQVVGIDNINDFYEPSLKEDRLHQLNSLVKDINGKFTFIKGDISDLKTINECFEEGFDRVINLAAQAGVRKSLQDPHVYVRSNIVGFVNVLEACRHNSVNHLTYASTSSVYGLNKNLPFSEVQIADHPIQLYAATKRSNELLAHSYSHLFNLPTTGLRFFTVYGPWGRPDMALFLFVKNILEGKSIEVFNEGKHSRDFTYIDDIVTGILSSSDEPAKANPSWDPKKPDPSSSSAPFRVLNIGNGKRVDLENYIAEIEKNLGKRAIKKYLPLQPGDVTNSLSNISKINKETGYKSTVSYIEGIAKFIDWYKDYYGEKE